MKDSRMVSSKQGAMTSSDDVELTILSDLTTLCKKLAENPMRAGKAAGAGGSESVSDELPGDLAAGVGRLTRHPASEGLSFALSQQ